jgi:hypothetical protein
MKLYKAWLYKTKGASMGRFRKFKEYLNQKGKTVEKPVIDASGDTSPKASKFVEPFATKGSVWEDNAALKKTPMPYSAPGEDPGLSRSMKLINGKDRGKPFGDTGDPKLKYEPDNEVDKSASSGGEKVDNNWPKARTNNKTEEFILKTKDMNPTQFAKYMTEKYRSCQCDDAPTVTAHKTGAIRPDPLQAVRYVSYLANCNETIMTTLVNEINRIGCIDKLLEECLTHRESYRTLAEALDNANFERKIERARREIQREETDQPAHDDTIPAFGQTAPPANGMPAIPGGKRPLATTGSTPAGIPGGKPGGTPPGPGNPALVNSAVPPPGTPPGMQTPGSPFAPPNAANQNLQVPFAGGGTT